MRRKPVFIHERPDWPRFDWRHDALEAPLAEVRHRQGRLLGRMESLGFPLQSEAVLVTLTRDVVKSSEIEGEKLDDATVRSSIARRLGIEQAALLPADRHVDGVVEMMLDATRRYADTLTIERLFGWHAALFPTGYSGMHPVRVGNWRDDAKGPMQVVSGYYGREKVHYQAPDAPRLPGEMRMFLDWFNSDKMVDPVLKAGLAHLWFVTLHPFDDGNGRIARTIADMALARAEGTAQRFYSMSAEIRQERKSYYDLLERTQRGGMDVTDWLLWFVACLGRSIGAADTQLANILDKTRFWQGAPQESLNDRQVAMLNRLLDGFTGKLTSSKWAKLSKCSADTALRDINDLIARGLLEKEPAGGRSTSYVLKRP
ncbi:MAG: Fic family protein [Pseudomonadota bacterium]|nr:Fic family protein [Pseudomonadota bacterium]